MSASQTDSPLRDVAIIRDDPPILVLNKPPGLATQAPPGFDSVVVRVKEYLKQLMQKPGNVYLGLPHRLDRPVGGVLIVARNSKAARRLAEQFRDRQVEKLYVALLEKPIDPPEGSLVHWMKKEKDSTVARIVESYEPEAKECSLTYSTLAQTPWGTLVKVKLGTGRYHQIRVQMSAAGCPVRGDRVYGGSLDWPCEMQKAMEPSREDSIALHAWQLTFFHPIRYDLVTASAPLPPFWPEDLNGILDAASRSQRD